MQTVHKLKHVVCICLNYKFSCKYIRIKRLNVFSIRNQISKYFLIK